MPAYDLAVLRSRPSKTDRFRHLAGAAACLCAVLTSGCSEEPPPLALPAPVAGLLHPEIARVGQKVLFDASPSAVARVPEGAAEIPPGTVLTEFRFAIADGTAPIKQTSPWLERTFASPGHFAVTLSVVDDRGLLSSVESKIHIVNEFTANCPQGDGAICDSRLCSGDVCAVLACAGQPACPPDLASTELTCSGGFCVAEVASSPPGGNRSGADGGSRTVQTDAKP